MKDKHFISLIIFGFGCERPKIDQIGIQWKRPMSSSGQQQAGYDDDDDDDFMSHKKRL